MQCSGSLQFVNLLMKISDLLELFAELDLPFETLLNRLDLSQLIQDFDDAGNGDAPESIKSDT